MLLSTKTVISSRSTALSSVAAPIMGAYITQAARVRIVRPELCAAVDGRLARRGSSRAPVLVQVAALVPVMAFS